MLRNAVASWLDAAARIERRDPESDLDDATAGGRERRPPGPLDRRDGARRAVPRHPAGAGRDLRAAARPAAAGVDPGPRRPWRWPGASRPSSPRLACRRRAALGQSVRLRAPGPVVPAQDHALAAGADFPEQVADAAWPQIAAAGRAHLRPVLDLARVDRVAARLRDAMEAADADFPLLVQGTSTRRAMLEAFRRACNAGAGRRIVSGRVSMCAARRCRSSSSTSCRSHRPTIRSWQHASGASATGTQRVCRVPVAAGSHLAQARRGAADPGRPRPRRVDDLDDRLLTKSYGRIVLDSLPPFARTRDAAAPRAQFLATLTRPT